MHSSVYMSDFFVLSSQDTDTQTVSTVLLTLRTPSCWFVAQKWGPDVLLMDVLPGVCCVWVPRAIYKVQTQMWRVMTTHLQRFGGGAKPFITDAYCACALIKLHSKALLTDHILLFLMDNSRYGTAFINLFRAKFSRYAKYQICLWTYLVDLDVIICMHQIITARTLFSVLTMLSFPLHKVAHIHFRWTIWSITT